MCVRVCAAGATLIKADFMSLLTVRKYKTRLRAHVDIDCHGNHVRVGFVLFVALRLGAGQKLEIY